MIQTILFFIVPKIPLGNTMSSSTCFARVKTGEKAIPGTDKICFTGGECGKPGLKKIVIDDGDSNFMICKECLKNFLMKGSSSSRWNGWFDCDYTPGSQFYGSDWWLQWKREGERVVECKTIHLLEEDPEIEALVAQIDDMLSLSSKSSEESQPPRPASKASKKEMLKGKISELNTYLKSPVKKTQKEIKAANHEEDPEIEALVAQIDDMLSLSSKSSEESQPPRPASKASKKEMLKGKISELNTYLKSPVKKTQKEIKAASLEVIKLTTELKLIHK